MSPVDSARQEKLFESEASWPFVLRQRELLDCLEFLAADADGRRVLRIFGSSGSGKSFFTRELLTRFAASQTGGATLYIDIPPSDFEAAALFDRVRALISRQRRPNRASPSFVAKRFAVKWRSAQAWPQPRRLAYLLDVFRDAANLLPGAAPFLKLFLPKTVGADGNRNDGVAALRYVLRHSSEVPVILALDNIQFLPPLILEMLDTELEAAGERFRLIAIERIHRKTSVDWIPAVPDAVVKDVSFGPATLGEVVALVREALPAEPTPETLAGAIHRRSDGNLKSVWFQLKFVVERRSAQDAPAQDALDDGVSYDGVISSLRPIDQLVLRLVVFLLGGLSISHLAAICEASDLHINGGVVSTAIRDLASLGLLIVNSDSRDRVRVEHELVAHVVNDLTPEDEKLELRQHLLAALSRVLDGSAADDVSLYDRLIGIAHETDVRARPALQAHIVKYLDLQNQQEQFAYLASISRDSVCWDVLDLLPEHSLRILLNAIQKCSLFNFGLVITANIRKDSSRRSLAALYEAKYLVQLFRYDEAQRALAQAEPSKDRQAVAFNIMINLCQDDEAAQIALRTYESLPAFPSEQDYVILRNSGHLFRPERARQLVSSAVEGFRRLGSRFGVATSLNNLGIVELFAGRDRAARAHFEEARKALSDLGSNEVYQPFVNLSALAMRDCDLAGAKRWLSAAREALPRLLTMDTVMIDANETVLSLIGGQISFEDALRRFRQCVTEANRTRDIRFAETVSWFCSSLEMRMTGTVTTTYSAAMIERIRNSGNVGTELFPTVDVNGPLDAPYFLSVHWRY